jgi:hypothetical protein
MKKLFVVRVDYSQTDKDYLCVWALTKADAEDTIRNTGCSARYIRAEQEIKRVIGTPN